ncbi:hypothetical protein BGE01nite_32650 [Brevifollis gellanilyticus]|uniref:Uncharacterized protein n=1 Tax=Brevifollis gellanilyticus TaxID=748831 RepID=A0A512MB68_9BACT|nr:hypothetical protein BGE01nite_32650 [Brevifollis gellanilyticus]
MEGMTKDQEPMTRREPFTVVDGGLPLLAVVSEQSRMRGLRKRRKRDPSWGHGMIRWVGAGAGVCDLPESGMLTHLLRQGFEDRGLPLHWEIRVNPTGSDLQD